MSAPPLELNRQGERPPRVTVLTTTYERAHLPPRPVESRARRAGSDRAGRVGADGSSDGTAETVRAMAAAAPFGVRYLSKANGGKHLALNAALPWIESPLTVVLDSDDALMDDAVAQGLASWDERGLEARPEIMGLYFPKLTERGEPAVAGFAVPEVEASALELRYVHGIKGDWVSFKRTAILRANPFPHGFIERAPIPESLLWHRLARLYRGLYLNRPAGVLYRHDGEARLTAAELDRRTLHYRYLQCVQQLDLDIDYYRRDPEGFARAARRMVDYGAMLGRPMRAQWRDAASRRGRFLWLQAMAKRRRRLKRERKGERADDGP